jgi:hypothetical protein
MKYIEFHAGKSFHELLSYSRISQTSLEPQGSLSYLQEPASGPYPEPDLSSPINPILFL